MLSTVSHTALVQTSVAAGAVHTPSISGFVCVASVGIVVPFASFAAQTCALSLHHSPPVQSASTRQVIESMHLPATLQIPERQTFAALVPVHGPSPLA